MAVKKIDFIVLKAVKVKEKSGLYKSYERTEFYQDGVLKATIPASSRQPKRGQKFIILNSWKFALKW